MGLEPMAPHGSILPVLGARTGIVVSSAKSLPERFNSAAILSTIGAMWKLTLPIQSARVERSISIPCRAMIWLWRYRGR